MKKSYVIHAVFKCEVCGIEWGNHKTAQREALKHHLLTSHIVKGEVCTFVQFSVQ